ncbi:ATP-binding cassette domain-containing protein, partial [Mycolicibacterium bacteremicum]|uniref:ATP-binding cassette domain-containing protein n=1 Tax=Mycolicibacterium bacteremicum TaxID=564198 RepID=UPI0026EC0426
MSAVVHGLTKSFDGHVVLDGIDLSVGRGEIVALVGRSGSGKSTLLRVLAGLSTDHDGEVDVQGTPTVVFQEPRLVPWLTVTRNVALGDPQRRRKRAAEEKAQRVLSEVGLSHRVDAWPLTLSGGEAQRAALARTLAVVATVESHGGATVYRFTKESVRRATAADLARMTAEIAGAMEEALRPRG